MTDTLSRLMIERNHLRRECDQLRAELDRYQAFVAAFTYYRETVAGDDAEAWDAVIAAHDAISARSQLTP